jgi:regulatory factor X
MHPLVVLQYVKAYRFDVFEFQCRDFWANLSPDHKAVFAFPDMMDLVGKAEAAVYNVNRTRLMPFLPLQLT